MFPFIDEITQTSLIRRASETVDELNRSPHRDVFPSFRGLFSPWSLFRGALVPPPNTNPAAAAPNPLRTPAAAPFRIKNFLRRSSSGRDQIWNGVSGALPWNFQSGREFQRRVTRTGPPEFFIGVLEIFIALFRFGSAFVGKIVFDWKIVI